MRSGNLDRRISILAIGAAIDDGMRSKPGNWFNLAKRWAELTPLSGAEKVAAAENSAVETLKFRVRRDSITAQINPAQHRIVYGDRTYDVQAKHEFGRVAFDLLVTGRADENAP